MWAVSFFSATIPQQNRKCKQERQIFCALFLCAGKEGGEISMDIPALIVVQRIPDVHCNGDMHDALEYAGRIKHEQKDFLTEQGIESIY